jgi:hypothetical protein
MRRRERTMQAGLRSFLHNGKHSSGRRLDGGKPPQAREMFLVDVKGMHRVNPWIADALIAAKLNRLAASVIGRVSRGRVNHCHERDRPAAV